MKISTGDEELIVLFRMFLLLLPCLPCTVKPKTCCFLAIFCNYLLPPIKLYTVLSSQKFSIKVHFNWPSHSCCSNLSQKLQWMKLTQDCSFHQELLIMVVWQQVECCCQAQRGLLVLEWYVRSKRWDFMVFGHLRFLWLLSLQKKQFCNIAGKDVTLSPKPNYQTAIDELNRTKFFLKTAHQKEDLIHRWHSSLFGTVLFVAKRDLGESIFLFQMHLERGNLFSWRKLCDNNNRCRSLLHIEHEQVFIACQKIRYN